jgi:endonuclease/exonuclease/phosphatase family metal-dependent hydrolase
MKKLRSAAVVLAAVLPLLGVVVVFGVCLYAIFALNCFGHEWALGAAVATLLVGVGLGPRLLPGAIGASSRGLRSRCRRLLGYARKPFLVVLACWLGLLGWSKLSRGGPMPAPKADPSSIRVVSWNIYRGKEGGFPLSRLALANWSGRKGALESALRHAAPDILCVQEALVEQVAFLEQTLPTHRRVGVGRDDGRSAGEHCAIYFNADRFEEIGGDTFWLEPPTDRPRDHNGRQPRGGLDLRVKRICTWVRLRHRVSGRTTRVYNIHSYLTEKAQVPAARVVLDDVAAGDPADAVILAGDFNATPDSASRRLFATAGLTDSAELGGRPAGTPTYQWYGIRTRCLDGILVSSGWQVRQHRILDVKPDNTFPSDHFGVLADLTFRD